MSRFSSIAHAVSAVLRAFAAAMRGAIRMSRRPAPSPTRARPTVPSPAQAAGVPTTQAAEVPVQPYPEEVEVDGRTIELPQPSFWPMVLAFGVTLLFFGLVTSAVIGVAGGVVIAWAIAGWIDELRHE
jgi:hypothetical protein